MALRRRIPRYYPTMSSGCRRKSRIAKTVKICRCNTSQRHCRRRLQPMFMFYGCRRRRAGGLPGRLLHPSRDRISFIVGHSICLFGPAANVRSDTAA
ncbi:hypothetical protein EVAR_32102_1 [Eumeta japonica]|uniref:Uncharacterized protein n=1 Tax=Eumeta variegata TaxID=151549 RepID=A0A4C1V6F6_EUMVA|nr:hypothetical protein EVAR_32102_1 [Eumeta japonica]